MECEIEIKKSGHIFNHNNGDVLFVTHLFWHDSNEMIQDVNGLMSQSNINSLPRIFLKVMENEFK